MKIDDPFAEEIAWMPLRYTRNGIGSRVLQINKNEASFVLDEVSKKIFKVAGVGIFLGLLCPFIFFPKGPFSTSLGTVFYSVMVLCVISFSLRLFKESSKTIKFCKSTMKFIKGSADKFTKLNDVYALQFIEKDVELKNTEDGAKTLTYYQLNLVLKNKERVHVIDLKYRTIESVKSLSEFIDKPLWDKTGDLNEDT